MPIQFTNPAWLLLLPLLLAAAWWLTRGSLASLDDRRRRLAWGLRAAVLALLVLALAGLQLVHTTSSLCTVFVLDVSESVTPELQAQALEYVRTACRRMRRGDTAAVVVFGTDAYIELPPDARPKITRLYSRPARNYTDLAAALRLALASFEQRAAKQVVLLSDGNENLGSALDQALVCQTAGVRVHTVGLRAAARSEALLERASLPPEVKQGEPFEVKLVASATAPAGGKVRLFRNGQFLAEQAVALPPGKSLVSIRQEIERPGFYTYEALLEAGPDSVTENNRALGFVQVRGKPQVLLLSGQPEQAAPLAKALASHEITISRQGLAGIPLSLAAWQNWDAVVFADVPAVAMTPEQMLMVQSYVRDLGGGFAMIGGQEGFGAGGYFKTPIEETLPVSMAIRKQQIFPSLAVLLIMDTSGSTGMPIDGREMIRLEAESAIQVVQTMQPKDQIGVIVSGEATDVLAPMSYATSPAGITAAVSRMQPGGGGIYCRPSMEKALEMMRATPARLRHIIMLADGSDCDEQDGCRQLAARMKAEHITFSTVSFGNGPHSRFLAETAALGGGNFYLATKASDLPRIFTKDAMLASKALLVEEPFRPKVAAGGEITRGLDPASMPPLLGYVATSPKSPATLEMTTDKDDPLLATWRYGLGRSVAFTSDAQPHWAAHWMGWPGYGPFWSQAVRWMLRRGGAGNLGVVVEQDRGVGRITVEAVDRQGEFENFLDLEARVVDPRMKVKTLPLEQTAPGRYSREFPVRDVGAYLVTVTKKGKQPASRTAGVVVPYSPDYRDLRPNDFLLARLADLTGGALDQAPEQVYGGPRRPARYPQDVWPTLLFLAALLWPLDVAARRLVIGRDQVERMLGRLGRLARVQWRLRKRRRAPAHDPTLGRLVTGRRQRQVEEPPAAPLERPVEVEPPVSVAAPARPQPARPPKEPPAEEQSPLARLKAAKERARKEE